MAPAAPRIALVAGEASGDLLAGHLLDALKRRWPALRSVGIGGPRMEAAGFEAWWPCSKLAVRGYAEVLRHYREIVGIRNELARRLLADPPDLFIGVDAPDFNLGLEERLRAAGQRTAHFVSPSIWAWRAGRIEQIRRAVDHMLCVFPFEPAMYADRGVAATYVGHPLADVIPLDVDSAAARLSLDLPVDAVVVALLPGSRVAEVEHLAGPFVAAARRMAAERPGLRVVLPAAPGLRDRIEAAVAAEGAGKISLTVLDGQSHAALAACDVAIVASGTATLETALFKKPMVIAYRMNTLSWWIHQRQRLQPWVGLPNILAREFLVPELLQRDATPEALARAASAWLDDAPRRMRLAERFAALHLELRRDTAPARGRASRRRRRPLAARWGAPGLLAGVDEAGRGPLAGPVVAAAVVLDDRQPIRGLADSKSLSPRVREQLFDEIRARALCCCIAEASVEEIDRLNILQATMLAMRRAVQGLRLRPSRVLVDGDRVPPIDLPAEAIVGGDGRLAAIAAASILAKVHRDRWCESIDARYPQYGFSRHKGYGTADHLRALQAHGPCEVHRRSFAPVQRALEA